MEKYNYEEWKKISEQLTHTKQNLQELSKLFIITHEKVKQILRKCQTNLQYDPTSDTEKQVYFIKIILERMADRQNDEYLSKIDPSILDKYQKHFQGLLQLLRLALMTQSSKQSVNYHELRRISEKKSLKNQFSLQNEIKKSNERMMRTKSGHRITKNPQKIDDDPQYNNLIEQKELRIDEKEIHVKKFLDKKQSLEKTMQNHIQKQGLSINFKNKYLKLDAYLEERKQFADLFFCQQYFDKMIYQGKNRKNETKLIHKKNPDLNKLFPEFNIKTKYMKKQVKQNIIQVIFDVKKELLKEYHLSNIKRMQEAKEGEGMVNVKQSNNCKKTNKTDLFVQSTTSFQGITVHPHYKSTNRLMQDKNFRNNTQYAQRKSLPPNQFGQTMHSLKNLKTTAKSTFNERQFWPQQIGLKTKEKVISRFQESKFKNYKKI